MITLKQIQKAISELKTLGGDKEEVIAKVECAIVTMEESLKSMDTLQVVGRESVDVLLGCMMAVETIIGDEKNG